MNFDTKRILAVALAGAGAGLMAAIRLDWREFKAYLDKEGIGSAWLHLKEFDWRAAVPRYWQGALSGAVAGLAAALSGVSLELGA